MNEDIRKNSLQGKEMADTCELTEAQLEEISGGMEITPTEPKIPASDKKVYEVSVQAIPFMRCSKDPSHTFIGTKKACPICGSTEYTPIR